LLRPIEGEAADGDEEDEEDEEDPRLVAPANPFFSCPSCPEEPLLLSATTGKRSSDSKLVIERQI